MFVVDASVRERDARFPATISDMRDTFSLLFCLPSLNTHIVELILAGFALSLRSHIFGLR
jgi:hypothetical protein